MRLARAARVLALCAVVLPVSGCITYPPGWDAETQGRDPYERINRPIFSFNRGVDRWALSPLATGWSFITPRAVRVSVDKFFTNLQFPRRLLANLGQGEVVAAGSELGRFLLNTTVGVVGFFDPATHFGMELYDEDFGQMFGRWGIPPGPYWVIPIFGPSNPRDGVGLPFDLILDLRNLSPVPGPGLLAVINVRALLDPQIDAAEAAALDLYVATRDAHVERRAALVRNEDVGGTLRGKARTDDLYQIDIEDPAGGKKPAPDEMPAEPAGEVPAEASGGEPGAAPAEETQP